MARLTVLEYPDARLRIVARPVVAFDAALSRQIEDLFETLYAERAIGLAATQVDLHCRMLVMDVSADQSAPQLFINPEILARDAIAMVEESCLSLPGISESVARSTRVTVRTVDRDGQPFERELRDLAAVCLQHEMDHLDGRLFADHLSFFKRLRVWRRLGTRGSVN
jgi:peptide deformylase